MRIRRWVVTMANIPPPPPLPLTTTKVSTLSISSVGNCDNYNRPTSLHNLSTFVKKVIITNIHPVLQTGANCGMAALAMVATLTPTYLSIDDIFSEAKSRGFSNNGEMFSAHDMKVLVDALLSPSFTAELFSESLAVSKPHVVHSLYNGDLLLIPYDADKDHSPCCKNGHNAHWAVVCGVMMDNDGEVYVTARHGKSRYLAVWTLDSLQRSNDNLAELDPEKASDSRQYIIPQGGVRAGLASKFVLLRRKRTVEAIAICS